MYEALSYWCLYIMDLLVSNVLHVEDTIGSIIIILAALLFVLILRSGLSTREYLQWKPFKTTVLLVSSSKIRTQCRVRVTRALHATGVLRRELLHYSGYTVVSSTKHSTGTVHVTSWFFHSVVVPGHGFSLGCSMSRLPPRNRNCSEL